MPRRKKAVETPEEIRARWKREAEIEHTKSILRAADFGAAHRPRSPWAVLWGKVLGLLIFLALLAGGLYLAYWLLR